MNEPIICGVIELTFSNERGGGEQGILGKNKWKYPVILDVVEVVGLSPQ